MLKKILDILSRGARFVRDNPQIIYTIFLAIAIPAAFLYTSERFLRVAAKQQDKLERNRITLLQDAFAVFIAERLNDGAYLEARINDLLKDNETITLFYVVVAEEGGGYRMVAPVPPNDAAARYTPDILTETLMNQKPGISYASQFVALDGRHWRAVRPIAATAYTPAAYIITDISMAQADAVARKNIRDAYLILAVIVVLIIILLARQARIIDYATLYARLKEVDRMKDDFVSMAAHELRSPLTVIRGYVNMIEGDTTVREESRKYLKLIDHFAQQLNSLITDILDVAKLQEGRMSFTLKPLDVSELITDVVESFRKPAADKGLQMVYEKMSLPLIVVDPDRFRQVMINLVGNAVKYTRRGEVRVITSATSDTLTIRVSDTGLGISAEDQKKLFQKFYRVKSAETAEITGTGLGLWITAEIIKTMKGTIQVESIKGKGTDFIVSFPIAK